LGASTPEAEENCAVMAVSQLKRFLETGNVANSVNYPNCELEVSGNRRLVIANKNIPSMLGQISTLLAKENINISDMVNRHRDNLAYNIIDIEGDVSADLIGRLKSIEGIVMVRKIDDVYSSSSL
jgi:D-3-phosphoglycerate dehydrogenase